MLAERISVQALIDFNFEALPDLDTSEAIADIQDRISRVEFLPSDIQRITLFIPSAENAK